MLSDLQKDRAKEVGRYFKKLRTDAGLTLNQAAKEMGLKKCQFIWNWEHGKSFPPMKRIKRIAKIYNTTDFEIRKVIYNFELAILKEKWGFKLKKVPSAK